MAIPYPGQSGSKKQQVEHMFDRISPTYDLINHLSSLGVDFFWRKKAIRLLKKEKPESILDIATGTADFALKAASLKPKKIIGIDISNKMLDEGRKKIKKRKLDHIIQLQWGDSENIDFSNNTFDAAIVAFGVRNFENLEKGLQEVYRVLKTSGTFVILELSTPRYSFIRWFYSLYFNRIVPRMGAFFSKDKHAYTYLPDSVNEFPSGKDFMRIFKQAGFTDVQWRPLLFGISSIYIGKKA